MISKCSSKHVLYFFLILLVLSALSLGITTWVVHAKISSFTSSSHPSGETTRIMAVLTVASIGSVVSAAAGVANSYLICFNSYQGCLAINFSLTFAAWVMEATCLVSFFWLKMDYWHFLDVTLKESLVMYGADETVTRRWDSLQESLECCGLMGPEDWTYNNHTSGVPASCCIRNKNSEGRDMHCDTKNVNLINSRGCSAELDCKFEDGFDWWTKVTLVVFMLTFMCLLYNLLLLVTRLTFCSCCPC